MNKHLKDGQLRAALDGELDGAGMQHLESCPLCKRRQDLIQSQMQRTASGLAFLNEPAQTKGPAAKAALDHIPSKQQ